MALADSVNQLAAEVAGLAGRVVVLNRAVEHMQATYVNDEKFEERLHQEAQTVKLVRTIVVAAAVVVIVLLGGFGWQSHQRDEQQQKADEYGAIIVSCIVAQLDEMRQAQDAHFAQTAGLVQKEVPPTAPVNGITREDVVRLCTPVKSILPKERGPKK